MIDWLNSTALTTFGAPTTWAEVLGFVTGLLDVWLVVRQHILNWPLGILNVALLMVVFFAAGLYADGGLQILYVLLGFYGWWAWARDRAELVVRPTTRNEWLAQAAARDGSPVLFGDTDAFATTIWEERYLGRGSVAVGSLVRRPDLYLLTDDEGVPFVDDGLRDGEHVRRWMTGRFRDELAASGVPNLVLTGRPAQRLRAAVAATDALLARGWSFEAPLSPAASGPNGE